MQLVEVNSKSTIKSFHNLPYKIYKGNKIWVPHLKQDIESEGLFDAGGDRYIYISLEDFNKNRNDN